MVIKAVWYWVKDRHKEQWDRIESPEGNPCLWPIDFHQGCQENSKGKVESFNKQSWDNYESMSKRMHLNPFLTPNTKCPNGSQDIRAKTIKLLEEIQK